MNNYIIYKYTSPSGKHYIGQTNDIVRRKSQHKKTNGCPCFKVAVDKYGFENFKFEILEENLTIEEANIKEEYYINEYNSLAPNGYNLHTGGLNHSISEITRERLRIASSGENNPNFGKQHSEETKAKIGLKSKGRQSMLGKKHTKESIAKMRLSSTNKFHTEETKLKIKQATTGENHPLFGKHLAEETKRKLREKNSKEYIITFPDSHTETIKNMKKFCENNNLIATAMSKVAMGKAKQHKGFSCVLVQNLST